MLLLVLKGILSEILKNEIKKKIKQNKKKIYNNIDFFIMRLRNYLYI
jgi:hypothetical protein